MIRTIVAAILLPASWVAMADEGPLPPDALLTSQRAQQAVEADAEDPLKWRALADARAGTGNYAEAIDAYAEMRERLAAPDFAAEVRAARIARLLDRREAYERYEETVMSGYRSAPPGSLTSSDLVAVGDVLRLRARSDSSLYQRALDRYEAAIGVDASDPAPHVAIGELLLDRFNNAEALTAFRDALALAPDDAAAMLGLARSQHFDRSSGAMDAVDALLARQPEHVGALALKARLTLELEDYAAAEALVNEGLAVNPNSPELLTMHAAAHYLRSDEAPYRQAVTALQTATPGYQQLFVTLAEVAEQNRRYEDAVRFAAYVTRIQREAWRAHALLGTNALRLGDLPRAREALETSFRGDPFNVLTKNKLELMDRLDTFERQPSERFELVATAEEMPILRERVLPLAERAFDYYEERYGYAPPTPIQLEFHASHEDFSVRITGLVGIDIVGVAFGPLLALDSPSAEKSQSYNWASVVWHEIAHSFHIGMTGSRVPRWFSEGLAVHEERLAGPGWGADIDPGFVVAYVEGKLARPSQLNTAFLRPKYAQAVAHAYMQASLLMAMIERDHGFEAIVAMLRGYGAGETTEQLLQSVLDTDLINFDLAFDDYMQSRFGEMIAALKREGDETGPRAGRYAELLKAGVDARQSDPAKARSLLEQARDLLPGYAGPGSAWQALAELARRAKTADGQPDTQLIETLEDIAAIDADNLKVEVELAGLYEARGDDDLAAATYERALLIDPFAPEVHKRLAELHSERFRLAAAVRAQSAVASLAPADPIGERYRLAALLQRAGDSDKARAEVLNALEQAPLYEDALELLLITRGEGDVPPEPAP